MIKVTFYKTEKVVLRFSSTERAQLRNAHILILLELDVRILFAPKFPVLFPLPIRTILARIDFSPYYDFAGHLLTNTILCF